MYKELEKLDEILKYQKKTYKKLKEINKNIPKNQKGVDDVKQTYKSNDYIDSYLNNFIQEYINGYTKSKVNFCRFKNPDSDNWFAFEYNNEVKLKNNGTLSTSFNNISTTKTHSLDYIIIRLNIDTCEIESNLYSNTFKCDLYSKFEKQLDIILEEKEKKQIDIMFSDIIELANLNRGQSFTMLDDILNDE